MRPLPMQQRVEPRARDDRRPKLAAHIERRPEGVVALLALLLLHLLRVRVQVRIRVRVRVLTLRTLT